MNILHIIPKLDYCGAAAQLGVLARHLPDTCRLHICCLSRPGPWAQRLRQQGRRVDCLNWSRVFDPTPLWNLRRHLKQEPPDVIHAWGRPALRALALAGRHWLPRTLLSHPLSGKSNEVGRIDVWLLKRVRLIAASSLAEANLLGGAGISANRIDVIKPGVEVSLHSAGSSGRDESRSAPRILCVGAMERPNSFRDAIWAFDMWRHAVQASRLQLAGAGSQRAYLEWFAACLKLSSSVDFLGQRDDVPQLMSAADMCWSPSGATSNQQVVLEAMAAGIPVIAGERLGLREWIVDGTTGFIVPAGDKVAICKRTRSLTLDQNLRHAVGAAARQHMSQHFSAAACAERWAEQYAAAA